MDLIINLIFFGIILYSMYLDSKERKRVSDRLTQLEDIIYGEDDLYLCQE